MRYVAQWQTPSVGLIAPEFRLVRGVVDVSQKQGQNRKGYVTVQVDENGELNNDLSSPRGPVVTLKEQREQGHVVLYFMRSFQCLSCRSHVRQLATLKAKLASYGATALIIGPGSPSEASALATRLEVPFPVLADEDGTTYAAYGLRKVMFNAILQSGTILIDREGVIRYARRATNPGGGFNQEALFLALRTM